MRLRCPAHDCAISLPEDLLGTTIRCPGCGSLIAVDAADRDITAEQIKPGDPSVTPASEAAKKEVRDLENQIYDGLPPLSVMLALRKRQGVNYDAADFARRYEMTDDDWKALDAFESVLYAVAAVRLSTVVCGVILAMNVLFLFATSESQLPILTAIHPGIQLALLLMMGVGIFFRYLGQGALVRIHFSWAYELLLPITLGAMVVFAVEAWVYLRPALSDRSIEPSFLCFVGVLLNLVGVFELGRSGLIARKAQRQLAPPEISHRLSEALGYLEPHQP